MLVVFKNIGETPLECLERTRIDQKIGADVPMTYAGRLDPLASGKLLILVGEECKEKEKYLGLDKEYEIKVLFGVKTDTGDALGIIEKVDTVMPDKMPSWSKFVGKLTQVYPVYSSKTVSRRSDLRKIQLHTLARSGDLPDEMPTKEVEIYSVEEIGKGETRGRELAAQAVENVSKVKGDFRQKDIIGGWERFAQENGGAVFLIIKLRVACSSGTYMRSLAERIGKEAGTVAFTFSIERTKIGSF